jgi:hypothetical protein
MKTPPEGFTSDCGTQANGNFQPGRSRCRPKRVCGQPFKLGHE